MGPSASSCITVLIADDDEAIRETLAAMVASDPSLELCDVVCDAAQAITSAACRKPHVALLDVRMPGGGASAVRGIKRHSPRTRVLALSIHSDRERVLEMLEAGADGYLVKGTSVDAITAAIHSAALGHGSLSAEVTNDVIEELADQLHTRRRSQRRTQSREGRVRRALEPDGLSMVFQPICTLAGETVGAEALARFACKPERSPDRWFADAREVGLLLELELRAARAALAALPAIPAPLYLTINVSPTTLAAPAFGDLLEQSDSSRVVVEITEHAPISDYDGLRRTLAALRSLGTRVAIDDAGAGFASLRHILRLRPEFIKLDRSLIDGIERDDSLQALAAGLISFGDKINATVIAEGIEHAAEVHMLQELGVHYGQGHHFAHPNPLPLPLDLGARSAARQDAA